MKTADSVVPANYLPALAGIEFAGITSGHIAYDEHGDLRPAASPSTRCRAVTGK